MTKWIAGLGLSAALAFAAPSSAEAQGPVVTGGLVNVTITDVIENVVVEVSNVNVSITAALALAANVCGVAVNVLAADFQQDGQATCTAVSDADNVVTITQQRGRPAPR
jgi:hypothetical protein